MPASMKMPSSTCPIGFRGRLQAEAMRAVGAGKHQRQPGGAVFEIVQRLRVGLGGIGMIDPLHDLPGRGRRRGRRSALRPWRAR